MKLEKFKEKNSKKTGILIFTIASILLLAGVFFFTSFASYVDIKSFNIISGNIPNIGDALYVYHLEDGTTTTLASRVVGLAIKEEESTCNYGVIPKWQYNQIVLDKTNATNTPGQKIRCDLYMKENTPSGTTLAKLHQLNSNIIITPSTSANPDFKLAAPMEANFASGTNAEQTSGLFEAEDDYGTSYYFRGSVNNNYVKFGSWKTASFTAYDENTHEYVSFTNFNDCKNAYGERNCYRHAYAGDDMYWQIVRINGDGSIRLLYYESVPTFNEYTQPPGYSAPKDLQSIGTSSFNNDYEDNAYVGYMYGTAGSNSYNATHANTQDSKVKTMLDNWYQTHLLSLNDYISDTLFCNDRSLASADAMNYLNTIESSNYTTNAFGTNDTIYGAYGRAIEQTYLGLGNKSTFMCPQKNDRFTVSDTTIGNGALTYPIGLITADELNTSGISSNNDLQLYLLEDKPYIINFPLTMTPSLYTSGTNIYNMTMYDYPFLSEYGVDGPIVPVINLKPGVINAGEGTYSDPFRIE